MNTIDEKTFKQGLDEFIGCAPEGGWSDYWAMQQDWEFYKDSLCRDGVITQKQADSWSNPCTPETFARWQKRNGLVGRGYESKKSEGDDDKVVPDENDFEKCPYCGSHNTDIHYEVDLAIPADVLAYATCKDCGKEYHGQFVFTGAYYGKDEHDYDPIDTCPFCGSKEHTETVQFDGGGYVDQDFKCKSCGGTWYNSFVWSDTQSAFESHTHKSESKKSEGLPFGKRFTDAAGHTIELSDWRIKEDDLGYFCGYDKGGKPIFDKDISKAVVFPFDQENYPNDEVSKEMDRLWKMGYTNTRKLQKATRVESKKSEDTYDRPVTLYASTRYDDAEEAQKFLDSISGGEVKVSKERNGDTLSVSIEGDDDAIDTFLAVYKDNYDTLEQDCDADVNGWTDPVDLKYYTVQGRKELTGESCKKSEASGNIRYDVPISSTTYASELESLVSKLKTSGISVKPKIYAEEDSTNGYAEYKLFGANSSDDIVVIVDISENHYTRITAITNRGKLVMEGYGQTFDEALSALNTVEESKKSEALTKDTVVVGTLDNSSKAWIERTLKQIKKKFPNVESDAFGCTITIRGKLADVSAVCDAYPKGVSSLWTDKGGDFLPNAAGDNLDYEEAGKVLSESKKSEGIGDRIKMGIDYNMFMRMCGSAAYLDDNEDYWDALWEYYSEMGEIEDACEFFDNLFQYTAWCDEDEVYDEYLDDKFKDESKSKEECIQAAIDDGDLDAYKHEKGNYLVIL